MSALCWVTVCVPLLSVRLAWTVCQTPCPAPTGISLEREVMAFVVFSKGSGIYREAKTLSLWRGGAPEAGGYGAGLGFSPLPGAACATRYFSGPPVMQVTVPILQARTEVWWPR